MRFLLRSAFACLPLQRKQLRLGIIAMHERLALDEVMIHDIKLSSLLSYVSAGSQPNNFPCRTSSWIKAHVLINNFSHSWTNGCMKMHCSVCFVSHNCLGSSSLLLQYLAGANGRAGFPRPGRPSSPGPAVPVRKFSDNGFNKLG